MITCRFDRYEYEIPSRWDDFTPEDGPAFIRMCFAFEMFETGRMDFDTFRTAVAAALLGIDVRMLPKQNDILAENIFRLVDFLKFPYSLKNNEDGSRTAFVKVVLRCNLLTGVRGCEGYRFSVTGDGLVDCNITAEQYVDALALTELYSKTRKDDALDELFSTLYKGRRKVPRSWKVAVYYNFRGILEWIKMLPDFRLIFSSGGSKRSGKSPLGLSSSIFTLSKSGYGTLQEIRSLDLFAYLGALVQLNVDGILSLRSAGLKPGEIAEKMDLPLECILPYITADNN